MSAGFDVSQLGKGSDDAFELVNDFLVTAGYNEETLCNQLGIRSMADVKSVGVSGVNDVLVLLFFVGKYFSRSLLEAALPSGVLDAMLEISLLVEDDDRVYCPILLYQTEGLYLASDRFTNPDATMRERISDFVFLAITENTSTFMSILPPEPKGRFLDIGTGAGVAALRAAAFADEAWGSDIAERSIYFAEFNRRLNGIDNARFVVSDLYSAIEGSFDVIVSHPPYVPGFQKTWIFAHGGDDGESITRGIVEGLPEHLAPGGSAYLLTMGSDREGQSFEQRIRQWLGRAESDFDIVVLAKAETLPAVYATDSVLASDGNPDDVAAYLHAFHKLQVTKLVYGAVHIARHSAADSHEPVTVRRLGGKAISYEHLRWIMDWERRRANLDYMNARPLVSKGLNVVTRHEIRDGDLVPVEYRITNADPIIVDTPCPAWVAFLLSQCNGQRTGRELHHIMEERAFLSESSFGEAIRSLGSAGVISFVE